MENQVYDLIESIYEKVEDFISRTGFVPVYVSISPGLYRRLLELVAWEGRIGNLIIGCAPLTQIETSAGSVQIVIDEIISDTEVRIAQ
jgi:hypothetical protein